MIAVLYDGIITIQMTQWLNNNVIGKAYAVGFTNNQEKYKHLSGE